MNFYIHNLYYIQNRRKEKDVQSCNDVKNNQIPQVSIQIHPKGGSYDYFALNGVDRRVEESLTKAGLVSS